MSIPSKTPDYSNNFKGFVDLIKHDAKQEIQNLREGKTQKAVADQLQKKLDAHLQKKLDAHPKLTELNNTANSRFNDEQLAKRLVAKYKDPEKINAAIDHIMENDTRFNNTRDAEFQVDHTRLNAIKKHVEELAGPRSEKTEKKKPESRSSFERTGIISDEDLKSEYTRARRKEKREKLQKSIASDLVGLINRKPTDASEFKDAKGVKHHMKQTPGHMKDGKFIPGHTISAELSNIDAKVMELPNQAVITFHSSDPNQADEVILGRSGRSDMQNKVDDKSQLDILSRLESKTRKGLKEVKDDNGNVLYEYQRSDVTMMDTNKFKSTGTTLLSGAKRTKKILQRKPVTPIESERKFVHDKRAAIKNQWAEGTPDPNRGGRRYIERTFTTSDEQTYTVREYEPLVWNFVFSSSAKSDANVKAARQDNIPNALYLFSQLVQEPGFDQFANYAKIDTSTKEGQQELAAALEHELRYNQESLKRDQMLALKAVLVTLTGSDEKGKNYDNKDGSDVQFILLNHLADLTGTAITVECKSGNDRTATAMALRCSLKEFERVFGRRYDPTQPDYISPKNRAKGKTRTDLDRMKTRFNRYALEFGAPNVRASRGMDEKGKAVLKTYTSPVFRKYGDIKRLKEDFNLI